MEKYSELYHDINNLLRFLDSCPKPIDEMVDDFYLKLYNNSAPGEIIRGYLKKLQKQLDDADDCEYLDYTIVNNNTAH